MCVSFLISVSLPFFLSSCLPSTFLYICLYSFILCLLILSLSPLSNFFFLSLLPIPLHFTVQCTFPTILRLIILISSLLPFPPFPSLSLTSSCSSSLHSTMYICYNTSRYISLSFSFASLSPSRYVRTLFLPSIYRIDLSFVTLLLCIFVCMYVFIFFPFLSYFFIHLFIYSFYFLFRFFFIFIYLLNI